MSNSTPASDPKTDKPVEQKTTAAKLEEDDEFEDFPSEDWTEESTDLPTGNSHLWEESWDDDDTNDDFSAQLKYVHSRGLGIKVNLR